MSLIPDWAPNIHPLLVHFPLVLLLVAILVDCALEVVLLSIDLHKKTSSM